jgi:hypothetical protein
MEVEELADFGNGSLGRRISVMEFSGLQISETGFSSLWLRMRRSVKVSVDFVFPNFDNRERGRERERESEGERGREKGEGERRERGNERERMGKRERDREGERIREGERAL